MRKVINIFVQCRSSIATTCDLEPAAAVRMMLDIRARDLDINGLPNRLISTYELVVHEIGYAIN